MTWDSSRGIPVYAQPIDDSGGSNKKPSSIPIYAQPIDDQPAAPKAAAPVATPVKSQPAAPESFWQKAEQGVGGFLQGIQKGAVGWEDQLLNRAATAITGRPVTTFQAQPQSAAGQAAENVGQMVGALAPIGGAEATAGRLGEAALTRIAPKLAEEGGVNSIIRALARGVPAGALYQGGMAAAQGQSPQQVAQQAGEGAAFFGGAGIGGETVGQVLGNALPKLGESLAGRAVTGAARGAAAGVAGMRAAHPGATPAQLAQQAKTLGAFELVSSLLGGRPISEMPPGQEVPTAPTGEEVLSAAKAAQATPTPANVDRLLGMIERPPQQETAPAARTGPAVWRTSQGDIPVTVTGESFTDGEGRQVVPIEGGASGIPADEVVFPSASQKIFSRFPAQPKAPDLPMADRSYENVGDRSVPAYAVDNPKAKPFIQEEAGRLLSELNNSVKGERWPVKDEQGYVVGYDGTKSFTSDPIQAIKDATDATPQEIRDALTRIIRDQGSENTKLAKQIELTIDDNLSRGAKSLEGVDLPPNEGYLAAKGRVEPVAQGQIPTASETAMPPAPKRYSEPFSLPGMGDTQYALAPDSTVHSVVNGTVSAADWAAYRNGQWETTNGKPLDQTYVRSAIPALDEAMQRYQGGQPTVQGTAQAEPGAQQSTGAQGDVTLYSSVPVPFLKQFVEHDVTPVAQGLMSTVPKEIERVVNLLSPRTHVSPAVLDTVMKTFGQRNEAAFMLDRTLHETEKMFEKMPKAGQIAFIDHFKRGEQQPTPELQSIADVIKKIDDATYQEVAKYRPSLNYLENHFRVMWKTIPGRPEDEQNFLGIGRRPLEGSRGMLKKHTLADMSEGIARGGVPHSTNPITLFEMAQGDAMKFVSAQRMWEDLKSQGQARFVSTKDRPPADYVRLDDRIARVFFPVETAGGTATIRTAAGGEVQVKTASGHTVMVKGGEWYVEKNAARLLNNYLSRDLVRETGIGRGLLWLKNNTTAMELALSPFHFIFESVEAVGSQFGVGAARAWNVGVLQKNPEAFVRGLGEMLTAPAAPVTLSTLGKSAIKWYTDPQKFMADTGADSWVKQHPESLELFGDLFSAGGKLAMHEDYKINSIRTFQSAMAQHNYIGAAFRLLPAMNEAIMSPMFEKYIPHLKVGLFIKDYGEQLQENAQAVSDGNVSRTTLARQAWDRTENKFGELNFDTLFWNRTFKSSLQFLFRSVTWKMGNVRGIGGALTGQAKNFADPFKFARDEAGQVKYKGKAPKLDPGMAWMLGLLVTTATLGTIIHKSFTGQWPEKPMDFMFPWIGGYDREGNKIRVSVPTYFRDVVSLAHNPVHYMTSSMSGTIGNLIEDWNNKDYYGNFVYDPNAPELKKVAAVIAHMAPTPFSIQQLQQLSKPGVNVAQKGIAFVGFTTMPKDYGRTPFQKALIQAYDYANPHRQQTPAEQEQSYQKQQLRDKIAAGKPWAKDMQAAVHAGLLKQNQVKEFVKDAKLDADQYYWKSLPMKDKIRLWKIADPTERKRLWAATAAPSRQALISAGALKGVGAM